MQIAIDVDEQINTLDSLRARVRDARAYTHVNSVAYEELSSVIAALSDMIDRALVARSMDDV